MVHTADLNARTLPQYVAAMSASGGAFAAGTILGWTSTAQPRLSAREYGFEISEAAFSWIGSISNLGAAFSCIPIGILINVLGRKLTMLLMVLPFTLGWCLLIWAQNVEMMYIARFMLGIAGGAFCLATPIYTGEISQQHIRGICGTFFQLNVTGGVLFAYVIGSFLNVFWMSILCAIFPLISAAIFVFMPETPTYLVSKEKDERAIRSIQWLRGKKYDYKMEIEELKETHSKSKEHPVSIGKALLRPATFKALSIMFGLMLFQQMSGIDAIIFYVTDIFEQAGTGINDNLATIVVGLMQFVATFISVLFIDRLGRRFLLITSGAFMALSSIALGVYFYMKEQNIDSVGSLTWLPICSVCVFTIMCCFGFGPVPWLMVGEMFASDIKGVAGSMACTWSWILAFIVAKIFVNLRESLGNAGTFWLFSAFAAMGAIFVLVFVPETKNKSLNEIQEELAGGKSGKCETK